MDTKVCSKCTLEKSLDDFNADSRRGDGKRASCKLCDSEKKKQIRNNNLEVYRERNRENNRQYRERKRLDESN